MFALKKIIAAFLLPPGVFVLILLVAGWQLWRKQRRWTALASLLMALLMWALSTPQVSGMLMGRLESGFTIPAQPKGDVIVLLGGGIHDQVPDLTGNGAPSEAMMVRMVTALRLHRRLDLPILISGGSVYGGTAEAPVVRRFLMDLGVAERQILSEDKSRDTMENARFCRDILLKHGWRRPLLVTSAFHMRRSLEAFRRAGVAVTPLPAGFVTSPGHAIIWADFLPDSGALHGSATALHEYLGLLFYRLGGKGRP